MRRLDYLILQARDISRNLPNPDGTVAISSSFFAQAANDAQDRLQGMISALKITEKLFTTEEIIPLVAGQESYSLTGRLYMNRGIHMVEFSNNGQLGNYVILDKIAPMNRDTNTSDYPVGHNIRGGKIYVTPIPASSSGYLRVTYEKSLDDLDIRRGMVSTVSLVGGDITKPATLILDSTADETSTINLTNIDYICLVSATGSRQVYNIPIGSYTTSTNTLTIPATFTTSSSDVIPWTAVPSIGTGTYVTFGKYSTTHSQLPEDSESYLIHYMAQAALHKDSSNDFNPESGILGELEQSILKAIVSQTANIERVPQNNRYDW